MKKVVLKVKFKNQERPTWTATTSDDAKTDEEIVRSIRSYPEIEKIYEIKSEHVPEYLDLDLGEEMRKAEAAEDSAKTVVNEIRHLEDVMFLQSLKNKNKETYSIVCAFSAIAAISGIIGLLLSLLL